MKLVTAAEMRELDRRAIAEVGIPSLVLMENAGRTTYQVLRREFPYLDGEVAVLAGRGNNGGDGFVVARYLAQAGLPVAVFLLGPKDQVKGDAEGKPGHPGPSRPGSQGDHGGVPPQSGGAPISPGRPHRGRPAGHRPG